MNHSLHEESSIFNKTNKLNPRDTAKVILDHATDEIEKDTTKNTEYYNLLQAVLVSSTPIIVDTDFDHLTNGMLAHLEFTNNFLVEQILRRACSEWLRTACSDQAEVMNFILSKINSTLNIISQIVNRLHTTTKILVKEKNTFASKALSLAKAVRSVCSHDIDTTLIQSDIDCYTLISDLSIASHVSPIRVIQQVSVFQYDTRHNPFLLIQFFVTLGGTAAMRRYKPHLRESDDGSLLCSIENDGDNCDDVKLITTINDMVAFIETTYNAKLMKIFLNDVKNLLCTIKREDKIQNAAQTKASSKSVDQPHRSHPTSAAPASIRRRGMDAERASQEMMSKMCVCFFTSLISCFSLFFFPLHSNCSCPNTNQVSREKAELRTHCAVLL
jgi:hypothetical protein